MVARTRQRRARIAVPPPDSATRVIPGEGPNGQPLLVLGAEIDIKGSVYIDAAVHLEATIDGELRCSELTIPAHVKARGTMVAERVVVYGTVHGAIYADEIVLHPGCKVEGEIYHKRLMLEAGAYFEGKSRRVDDPIGLLPD